MTKNSLNASVLEKILIGGIIPLVAVFAFAMNSLFKTLEEKSKQASHTNIDSELSSQKTNRLKELEIKLNKYQDVSKRAAAIVADSKQYRYQDQIVNDINTYAEVAGVTILGFNFNEGGGNADAANSASGNASTPAVTPPSGQSTDSPATTPPTGASKSVAPGLKTVNASIQLDSPIPLSNFLIFLKYIEQNVTKMQVTGVTLTPSDNPKLISNPTINVTVYTR